MRTAGFDMPGSHHVGGWMLIEVACQQRGLGSCQQCQASIQDPGEGNMPGILGWGWENWTQGYSTLYGKTGQDEAPHSPQSIC